MPPKKTRDCKRQTKISFSPAAKSSPVAPAKPSPSNVASNTPTKAMKLASSRGAKRALDISSDDEEMRTAKGRSMRAGMPVRAKTNGMFGSSDIDIPSDDSTSEESEVEKKVHVKAKAKVESKSKPTSRKRRRSSSSMEVEDDLPKITVKPRKRTRQSARENEASEEEAAPQQPSKRRRVTRRQSTPEEEEPERSPTPPRSTRRRLTRRPHAQEDEDEEEEEKTPPRSTKRKASRRQPTPDEDDSNESGADLIDGDEREELKEELAFLKSSPPSDKERLRQERPKDKRQAALEALKKKRAGTQDPPSTPARKQRTVIDSDSESELEVIKEEPGSDLEMLDDDEDSIEDADEDHERDANALDMFQEDNDDAGFIDDDPDALIGGPDEQMPIEFSSLSRAKPKDLFKYAVEWMVMKKIHPAFNSGDDIYQLTFRKLEDEVQGLANSKFTSSAWTPDFARAIRARPDLLLNEIYGAAKEFMTGHCEACNRKNHPASFELSLTGQPYNKDTLEPLETGSDSDSDSSDSDSSLSADGEAALNGEAPAFNAAGERLPPESKMFTLGRTCKANAQVSHTLLHWRYHLYQWVKDYLERENYMTAEKLLKRNKKSDRKREKEARKIVDRMESGGEIKKLHHLYKDQVRFALEAQNDFKFGWGRK